MSSLRIRILSIFLALLLVLSASELAFAVTYTSVNGTKYYHPKAGTNCNVFLGVDVSYWQGKSIDWVKVKQSGVDFAILRVGYTSLDAFKQHVDSTFATNVKNATAAGINVGVYFWSEATTEAEAKKEAAWVIDQLSSYKDKITMPVAMDYEFASGSRSSKAFNKLTKTKARKQFTANAVAFLKAIEEGGYTPMFYTYRAAADAEYGSGYKINMASINGSNQYRFWLAQFSSENSYTGNVEMWQHSSTGSVPGISGKVDRNFWYYDNSKQTTKSGTKSIKDCTVTLAKTTCEYTGGKQEPGVTVKDGATTLKKGTDYQVLYLKNCKNGTAAAIIRGIGSYSNDVLKTFSIKTTGKITLPRKEYHMAYGSVTVPIGAVTNGSSLTYTISDPEIAEVSASGVITPKAAGDATIHIVSPATSAVTEASADITIHVTDPPADVMKASFKVTGDLKFTAKWTLADGSGKQTASILEDDPSDQVIATYPELGDELGSAEDEISEEDPSVPGEPGEDIAESDVNLSDQVIATESEDAPEDITDEVIATESEDAPEDITETEIIVSSEEPAAKSLAAVFSEAEGYEIFCADNKGFKNGKAFTVKGANVTSAAVTCPVNARTVYVKVRSFITKDGIRFYGGETEPISLQVVSDLKAPTALSVSKVKKNWFKLTWTKVNGAGGYQIRYSKTSSMKKSKTKTAKKAATTSKKVKNKYKSKYAYVKVRAYKVVSGKKYYSPYSRVLKVRTK